MITSTGSDTFYGSVPVFRGFGSLMDPALYLPLPDDWSIGVADILESTKAIAEARYKAVNMAGASVIAAVTNALDGREFPFVFGGDGASFAVAPDDLARARDALAATATWVRDDLDLLMRVALVPVKAVRAQGLDVRVARFGPSPNLSYAMFSGGGLGWAETAMKRGEFAVEVAPSGTQPDLTGLSCRFEEIPATRGLILSVLVVPVRSADPVAFRKLIEDLIALVERSPDAGRPVPLGGPPLRWPPAGVEFEARAARAGPLFKRRAFVLANTVFVYLI
ncbi:MAG: adenylate cyclase, partial [Bradyrhizobium sp.]|nr:adenylate cyclase [Bradyrhizobium sp.]